MTTDQISLFKQLEHLVATNDCFEAKDIMIDNILYRTYNYRIASYTDFLLPGALEARGIMFRIGVVEGGAVVEDGPTIVCRPFKKFFNHMENPFTIDVDLSQVEEIWDKADGTMLSSFLHNGILHFKTRKTVDAQQVTDAVTWLMKPDHRYQLYLEIYELTRNNCTVILEWTAPDNRIVLEYKEPKLTILGIRDNRTGEEVETTMPLVFWPKFYVKTKDEIHKFLVEELPHAEEIEGVVVKLASGQRIKFKTEWYQLRHGTIDIVLTPKRLFEALIDEKYDELKVINKDIPYLLEKIEKMYVIVKYELLNMMAYVDNNYFADKDLPRKDFAIKYKDRPNFGSLMTKYLGKEPDYKKAMMNLWKERISGGFMEKEYMGAQDEGLN